jgi:hypothetical protein
MRKYEDLTIEQLRSGLDFMELNFDRAMDCKAYGLAQAFKDKIDDLMAEVMLRQMLGEEEDCF